MRFTNEMTETINKSYKDFMSRSMEGVRISGRDVILESHSMAICDIDELTKVIDSLKLMVDVIKDETGIIIE